MPLPFLLVITPFARDLLEPLAQHYEVVHWRDLAVPTEFLQQRGSDVRAVVTNGVVGLPAGSQEYLDGLHLIACNGVGYDAIDLTWACAYGVTVTNTPDVLSSDVADLALALLLAVFRQIPQADRYVREGSWRNAPMPLGRRLAGSRIGVLGLGRIGRLVAQRCIVFDTTVAYSGRARQADVPYEYMASATKLATWADVLIAATPGGASTRHLVSSEVLQALGPQGVFINISRGSVVDEEALVAALASGGLAGAGLDVFAIEPHVPESLLLMPHVVLTPHIASATTRTRRAMAQIVVANLMALAAHEPLPTPVT